MPQMGVSVTEGTVIEWRLRVGDPVETDQVLCEISSDKVETEIPSPAGGTLAEILVPAGKTVPVGTVLANISTTDSAAGAIPPPAGARAGRAPAAEPPSRAHGYSPVVRRMAAAHGLDLDRIEGTGRGGRVTKQDVLAVIGGDGGDGGGAEGGAAPGAGDGAAAPATGTPEPLSHMRRAIAEHMTRSLATAAHCHTFIEVEMMRVEAARRELGTTALPIVARATIDALEGHPSLNAWIDGDSRTLHAGVQLGIAVSLGEEGLIVPVVRDAHLLPVADLATAIEDLARRARARELEPDEVQGGTFTITNQGRYGTLMSTPIINQPQVAILDLQAIVKRAVVVDDAIAIRPMTVLGLGWDHRALDGALAAEFLATLRRNLESWPA
jgi:pyruvate/2-oxoglutarate dehydrogenase complex dihydrolipoamide acyltransferase (E2) component